MENPKDDKLLGIALIFGLAGWFLGQDFRYYCPSTAVKAEGVSLEN